MITLVLGGTRSGKSAVAERLAAACPGPVTYVATLVPGSDRELAARIEAHRARRPPSWTTVELGHEPAAAVRSLLGTVIVDSLGGLVATHLDMGIDVAAWCEALVERGGDTVVVSDEVGMGVHPSTEVGRRFRDALGELNVAVADVADQVLLVVAGRVLRLDDAGGP
ncbi:MAG TPA: bifunctional adenosylcobinamide kinase/adenosylcobinamide-phosphate guanylyltransferase [Acidimicrobiales bacterium]|nr:bifunctional adenosylcobinamide kinase/adenosylcobinamide-phosphate guanylyltransferase [Acidimicrobiales bacterium]